MKEKIHLKKFNQESYNTHGKEYSEKVRNREKFQHLDSTDAVALQVMSTVLEKENLNIIDVGCGTGDRLEIILEKLNIDPAKIDSIIGLDYSEGMLEIAKSVTYKDKPVYSTLQKFDATKDRVTYKGNIVLCLWTVLNNITKNRKSAFQNLASMCNDDGYIMLDVATVNNAQYLSSVQEEIRNEGHLPDLTEKNIYYYKRDDGTVANMRLMSVTDSNKFINEADLIYHKVFGFNKNNPEMQLAAEDTENLDESLERTFDALFFILKHKKTKQ